MFVPLYDRDEVDRMFEYWLNGSLDGMHSLGNAVVGVADCDYGTQGFRAQSLNRRYLSEDIAGAIADLAIEGEPMGAAVLVLVLGMKTPVEYVARALGTPCTLMLTQITCWVDRFMARLLNSNSVAVANG
jgi:hypothetical protein